MSVAFSPRSASMAVCSVLMLRTRCSRSLSCDANDVSSRVFNRALSSRSLSSSRFTASVAVSPCLSPSRRRNAAASSVASRAACSSSAHRPSACPARPSALFSSTCSFSATATAASLAARYCPDAASSAPTLPWSDPFSASCARSRSSSLCSAACLSVASRSTHSDSSALAVAASRPATSTSICLRKEATSSLLSELAVSRACSASTWASSFATVAAASR
mmetsp:Transcript_6258/g.13706  ORF Transcript_6258/g.13706 Transcript_6258/m.13706 type:complete len:220 (+) Transcript_6258:173-832(+)